MTEGGEVREPIGGEPVSEVHYIAEPSLLVGEEDKEVPMYRLDLEEAREVADLYAISRDIQFVINVSDYLARYMEQRQPQTGQDAIVGNEDYLARALYTAALIAYTRCFGTGKRGKLDANTIFTGDTKYLLTRHEYYQKTRDRHLAHSVNAFEYTNAVAGIEGLDTDNPKVVAVGPVHGAKATDHINEIRWLVRIAAYVQIVVFGRQERAQEKLEDRVRHLSNDELKKLQPIRVPMAAGPEAAATPRQ